MANFCKYQKLEKYVSYDGVNWMPTGEYKKGNLIEYQSSDCPNPYLSEYFALEAVENCVFKFTSSVEVASAPQGTWTNVAANQSISRTAGKKTYFRKTVSSSGAIGTFSASTGNFKASGNIMSLVYGDNFSGQTSLQGLSYAFQGLFKNCSGLTSIDNLMLPATTLAESCYDKMFRNCTSLTEVPTDLLPSVRLENNCYNEMFEQCSSLRTAPDLLAPDGAYGCYVLMFYGCSSLNYVKCLLTTIDASQYTNTWLSGVSASGTFIKSPNANWGVCKTSMIPCGWTVQNA
jgi:hypothetical protein